MTEHEATIRLSIFAGVFAIMAVWEGWAPRRQRALTRKQRWPANIALTILNIVVLKIALPLTVVEFAGWVTGQGYGLLNQYAMPYSLKFTLSLILLDLVIYLQHVWAHTFPILWRLHRVHHADLELDVTSGVRFHTIEILLSMGVKFAAVIAFGVPPWAMLTFEVVLNGTAMFNHSNVWIPLSWDRYLRWIVVTPDMHRVHHSVHGDETWSNFGFNLPWWDYLCRTYRAQPRDGHLGMTLGLADLREPGRTSSLWNMLRIPLIKPPKAQTPAHTAVIPPEFTGPPDPDAE